MSSGADNTMDTNLTNQTNLTAEQERSRASAAPWTAQYGWDYDMVDDGPSYLNRGWSPLDPLPPQGPAPDVTLPNVVKYDYGGGLSSRDHYTRLVKSCVSPRRVLFCPKLGHIYVPYGTRFPVQPNTAMWAPTSSLNSHPLQWSLLKSIQTGERPISLWNAAQVYAASGLRATTGDPSNNDIHRIIDERLECYLVPMDDTYYSYWTGDADNFNIYVKNEGVYHYSNITDKMDTLKFLELSSEYQGDLYRISDNAHAYSSSGHLPESIEPIEPIGPIGPVQGGEDQSSDQSSYDDSYDESSEEYADTPDIRSESGREKRLRVDQIKLPQIQLPLPPPQEKLREDPHDGRWYTKDEFYEYYHTDRIWEMQHPQDVHVRREMYDIVEYAQTTGLSDAKTRLLLQYIMRTY